MSYDLFFRSRHETQIPLQDFADYFRGRANYEVGDAQFWYVNKDTGVYFGFEFNDDADQDDETDPTLLPIAFNLNYYRPHCFGLGELTAFVQHFELTVSDPQTSGMGDGEYSAVGFLRGWTAGNDVALGSIGTYHPDHRPLTLPTVRVRNLWEWNFSRRQRQEAIGDRAYVPKIFFFSIDGAVQTGIAWADVVPILLPKVDFALVPRKELSPDGAADDIVILQWREFAPLLDQFEQYSCELDCYQLFYDEPLRELATLVRGKHRPDSFRSLSLLIKSSIGSLWKKRQQINADERRSERDIAERAGLNCLADCGHSVLIRVHLWLTLPSPFSASSAASAAARAMSRPNWPGTAAASSPATRLGTRPLPGTRFANKSSAASAPKY